SMLRAVLLEPYDGLAPLALADWCEENGRQDEADFIRRPVPVAPPKPTTEYFYQLRKCIDDLVRFRYPFHWHMLRMPQRGPDKTIAALIRAGGWPRDRYSVDPGGVDVEQGFVVSLRVQRFTDLRRHAAAWFSTNPIRHVYIENHGRLAHTRCWWYNPRH